MTTIKVLRFEFEQIATSQARELALQSAPGVYAWYRGFRQLETSSNEEEYARIVKEFLCAGLSEKFSGRLGFLYSISLQERAGPLPERKDQLIRSLAQSAESRAALTKLIRTAEDFQSPLYVGKAIDIHSRISEHIDGVSDLSERFGSAGIPISDCFLRVLYIEQMMLQDLSGISNVTQEEITLLIEDLVTRLAPAAFVRRPG